MTPEQIPVLAGALTANQSAFGGLTTEEGQWVIKNPKDAIALFVGEVKKDRLRRTFKPLFTNRNFSIEDDGLAINNARLKNVFPGGIDPDVENWGLNEYDELTGEISPKVYELQNDFLFSDEWENFFIWSQAVRFCEKYPELFGKNFFTLLPIKKGKERFVADVRVCGGLEVEVVRFENNIVCDAENYLRLVVPQPLAF
jgi:hypothetical protein